MKQTAAKSGMILLLHIDAGNRAAGVVSIPPGTVVNVPGHGRMRIEDVDAVGGVPINHFAQIDFVHVAVLVDALGGVSIRLPSATESFGHHFRAGVNQIGGIEALEYTGDPALTEAARELRQQYLTPRHPRQGGERAPADQPAQGERVGNGMRGPILRQRRRRVAVASPARQSTRSPASPPHARR